MIIKDIRGSGWTANFLEVIGNRIFYAGFRIDFLTKTETIFPSKHLYDVISKGFKLGEIALSYADQQKPEINNLIKQSQIK